MVLGAGTLGGGAGGIAILEGDVGTLRGHYTGWSETVVGAVLAILKMLASWCRAFCCSSPIVANGGHRSPVFERMDEISCCCGCGICGGHGGHGLIGREELNGVGDSFAASAGYIYCVATVVIWGCYDVPTVETMRVPC